MRAIYIGGGKKEKNKGNLQLKLYVFLFLFIVITGSILHVSSPVIVEYWLNQKGSIGKGYAFSVRDVSLSLWQGKLTLNDVKIINPKTNTEFLEAPNLVVQVNWQDLLISRARNVTMRAEKADLILSKDLSSELARIKSTEIRSTDDLYLDSLIGTVGQLNVIEKKEDLSRTVLELNDVSLKVKDFSVHSVNSKTNFSISSKLAQKGKLELAGRISSDSGNNTWSIGGTLKGVPSDIFNKISGDKLPFAFTESVLNAEISANTEHGKITGEISPDIRRLNLLEEKPGVPTQTIARVLTDELTFSLPFTIEDDLELQYVDTYRKLKTYRKDPPITASTSTATVKDRSAPDTKGKSFLSFWPF